MYHWVRARINYILPNFKLLAYSWHQTRLNTLILLFRAGSNQSLTHYNILIKVVFKILITQAELLEFSILWHYVKSDLAKVSLTGGKPNSDGICWCTSTHIRITYQMINYRLLISDIHKNVIFWDQTFVIKIVWPSYCF